MSKQAEVIQTVKKTTTFYVKTALKDMQAGDQILVAGYKTPFEVTEIKTDSIVCRNRYVRWLELQSPHYQRIVTNFSEIAR